MKFFSCTLFLVLVLTNSVISLNILAIFPYHGKSHFLVFKVFLRELANRNHNVTVISHFPIEDPPSTYHHISLAGTMEILKDDMPVESSYKTVFDALLFLTYSGKDNCEVMLANQKVRELVASQAKFDVALVEHFNSDCGLGIAYKLNVPVVAVESHILMPWHYERFGIPYNPAYVSFHFLEGGTKPTLYQRVERNIFNVISKNIYYFISQRSNQNTLAKYFDNIPPLEELAREIKFLLIYQHFTLTGSVLLPRNIIEIGGFHIGKKKPLPTDLQKFMDDAEHGVIYISFGSLIGSTALSSDKLNAILGTIKELPQRFIWKWADTTLVADKEKLFISSWLPQADILGHPKTVAFLSHAGMGGTSEAIHFGIPVVAMPVSGDQPANAAAIEESGLGIQLHIRDFTKENLVSAFQKVLDPKFNENVKKLSRAWHDRPLSPLDTAVFWTEYAAKHSNFTYRCASADVPLYQYIYIDVLCVLALILSIPFIGMKILSKTRRSQSKETQPKTRKLKKSKKE